MIKPIKNFIIFGGSKGLGFEISEKLANEGHNVLVLSRNFKKKINKKNLKYQSVDLLNIDDRSLNDIINFADNIDGICFSQRFRLDDEKDKNSHLKEYDLMVGSIAQIMLKIRDHNLGGSLNFTRCVIIGSTYSSRVGFDQDWSYHCSKAAQLGLTKFLSVHSEGMFNINMISPSVFMKKNNKTYWETHDRYQKWKSYPSDGMITSESIVKGVLNLLIESPESQSGNNIFIDSGVSHLYHDQNK